MKTTVNGNNVRVVLTGSEDNIVVTLPAGYSYEKILITGIININYFNPLCKAVVGSHYTFPPFKSKSPATIKLLKTNPTGEASIVLTILKFGQIPDINYFDKNFEPILVTGDDGNEYNVIPSDQFK